MNANNNLIRRLNAVSDELKAALCSGDQKVEELYADLDTQGESMTRMSDDLQEERRLVEERDREVKELKDTLSARDQEVKELKTALQHSTARNQLVENKLRNAVAQAHDQLQSVRKQAAAKVSQKIKEVAEGILQSSIWTQRKCPRQQCGAPWLASQLTCGDCNLHAACARCVANTCNTADHTFCECGSKKRPRDCRCY